MNYYNEIKKQIINNEITKKVKDYSKNKSDLSTYYNIGKLLVDAGKCYGESIIKKYSKKLTQELGKNYSIRVLYKMIKFYNFVNSQKMPTLSAQLSWSHYDEILKLNDINQINYYIKIAKEFNLSVRELRQRVKNKEYERIDNKTKLKLISKEQNYLEDFVKNPIIINNINHYEVISEKILQKIIMEDIVNFLRELGNSFCFIANEYRIKIGTSYNYIDLLLYNIDFNCYVVIELKISQLKKEHIGQIEIYMNYIDKHLKKDNQNTTIGIIICKKDNKYIMEYCSDNRILSKEYELII